MNQNKPTGTILVHDRYLSTEYIAVDVAEKTSDVVAWTNPGTSDLEITVHFYDGGLVDIDYAGSLGSWTVRMPASMYWYARTDAELTAWCVNAILGLAADANTYRPQEGHMIHFSTEDA